MDDDSMEAEVMDEATLVALRELAQEGGAVMDEHPWIEFRCKDDPEALGRVQAKTYLLKGACMNCGFRQTISVLFGQEAPRKTCCRACGCCKVESGTLAEAPDAD
jgi:hypothetical protein